MFNVTLKDFQLFNTWEVEKNGRPFINGKPAFIIDETTKQKYWNESKGCVGLKCFLLTLGTPIVHSIASLVNVAYRIVNLISFYHFWKDKELGEYPYSFKERLKEVEEDLLRIIGTPIAVIGLEFAAIFGIFSPYNGRKLYASIERAQYETCILAPCFQPEPTYHLFGGNPEMQNSL